MEVDRLSFDDDITSSDSETEQNDVASDENIVSGRDGVGRCRTDSCKRKEYTAINGFCHSGKVLAVFERVPLKFCIVRCRKYIECRSFNMKWINPKRTFGICTLLEEVYVANLQQMPYPMTTLLITVSCFVIYQSTNMVRFQNWCPKNMDYFMRTGACLANKTRLDWYEGEHFCKNIYPGAHLLDIKSEAEQLAYVELYESFNLSTIWTSAKRPEGGAINEFYWTNSGKPLVYENWREDQPYTASFDSDCVSITKGNFSINGMTPVVNICSLQPCVNGEEYYNLNESALARFFN
ncbi:hypothetical protein LSH36_1016g00003 [Paralvinella palmiformis]|uniref:C-type lectin domain-containing protein n=1 Tax=Paralvinella palmiformis TaxID=53620 RepID=A0AAD9MQQ1_9ANNE|nr:hypothetical protein LSH36_1016g00003 [Paralvinella palmiformis]